MNEQTLKKFIEQYATVHVFAVKHISELITETLEEVSFEQFCLLRQLVTDGPLRPTELATQLRVNKSAITAKLDRLQAKGYVDRKRDAKDGRVYTISITSEGVRVHALAQQKVEEFVGTYIQELTEDELHSFLAIYEKILRVIEKRGDKA
ncbi:MarR family winged helix-turn-helix transcriptional regulator [Bacillus fonticola]|uniref:MarR family winged helix-turn-helix transcriptional regulator n=1 Tax=Bacillus fonticola TaxID=2728853 RepID=UPI0014729D9B|nr:MarR family transcriptional regulator [Bacillus fonticola]